MYVSLLKKPYKTNCQLILTSKEKRLSNTIKLKMNCTITHLYFLMAVTIIIMLNKNVIMYCIVMMIR